MLPNDTHADSYLRQVLTERSLAPDHENQIQLVKTDLQHRLQRWRPSGLLGIHYSGSYAKRTAVRGGTDVDLLVSLTCRRRSMRFLFRSLTEFLAQEELAPSPRDVAIKFTLSGLQVDLVPIAAALAMQG